MSARDDDLHWYQQAPALLPGIVATSVPIAIGQLGQMTMILIDMYMVGKLGAAAISGVGLGSAFFYVFGLFCAGTLFGLDYFVANAMGRDDVEDCHRWLWQGCYLSLALALPLMAVAELAFPPYILAHFPADVAAPAVDFLRTLSLCLPGFLIFVTFRQYLQATGSVRAGTVVTLLAIGSNALFNWLFVFGSWGAPNLGVAGAGLATTITRTLMAIALVAYTFYRDRKLALGLSASSKRLEPTALRELASIGVPTGIQLALESGVFSLATALISQFGVVSAAGHTIVLNVASFIYTVPTAIAGAAAILVGQALGRGQRGVARATGWTAIALGATFMGLCGYSIVSTGRFVVGLFTTEPPVIELACRLLVLVAVFQVADACQSVGGGALRGIGETRSSMLANLVGYWFVGLPLAYALGQLAGMGVFGFWLGLTVGLFAVAAVVLRRWHGRSA